MKNATLSIQIFATYLFIIGLGGIFIPQQMMGFLGITPPQEVWVRILALVIFVLSLYYFSMARQNIIPFYWITTWGRVIVGLGTFSFILAGWAEPRIAIFATIDTLGGIWTYFALKSAA